MLSILPDSNSSGIKPGRFSLVLDIEEHVAAAGLDPSFYVEGTYDDVGEYD